MESLVTTVVALILALLLVSWLFALIKKIGGCFIHLLLLGAGLVLLAYILLALQR
jgi:hypothetical protein